MLFIFCIQNALNAPISARRTIENAFGRLKVRWRRLLKDKLEMKTVYVTPLVLTACALHNWCEREGDSFNEAWTEAAPVARSTRQRSRQQQQQSDADQNVANIRQALFHYFSLNPLHSSAATSTDTQ